MELIQTKSLLAKLMATENLHIEQRNVSTASFDVENRVLTIPVLDKNLSSYTYDLFVGHEVGHALYTPLEGLKKAVELKLSMSVMNVLEDSRIERKIKQKYPGIRQSFIKAYKELMEKNFFGTAGTDLNKLNFIDKVNLYCKGGVDLGLVFTDEEKSLINEVESTSTYDDVIELYKKIADHMENEPDQPPPRGNPDDLKFSDEDDLDEEEGQSGSNGESEDGEDENEKNSSGGDDSDGEEDEGEPNSSGQSESEGSGGAGAGNKGVDFNKPAKKLVSWTDETFRRNEFKLFSDDNRKFYYGNIPKMDLSKIIIDHKILWTRYRKDVEEKRSLWALEEGLFSGTDVKSFQKLREDSKKVVSYLVKEFELKKNAEQLKRTSIAKTGDLNMAKIYSYNFSEDIFKKMAIVPNGKSHGLVMFIDWSGSMGNNIANTIKQLLNLVMFCKKVNIPFEVYAFTQSYDDYQQIIVPKKDDMRMSNFHLMNLLSSRMNSLEYSYAASALVAYGNRFNMKPDWFGLSGTPLNEAIVAAMEIVPKFQKENRLQVVNTVFLTDGDGHKDTNIYDATGREIPIDNRRGAIIVIRDPVSKHEVNLNYNCWARELTACYIQLLKARTNTNIVGFYILNNREFSGQISHFIDKEFPHDDPKRHSKMNHRIESMKNEFRKKKYQVVTNAGYDEYYLLRAEGLDTDDDAEFEVKENATTRGFVSAFSKFQNNRKANRVVLGRFIDMIT